MLRRNATITIAIRSIETSCACVNVFILSIRVVIKSGIPACEGIDIGSPRMIFSITGIAAVGEMPFTMLYISMQRNARPSTHMCGLTNPSSLL